MTDILRFRALRFQALYALLTGDAGLMRGPRSDQPDHPSPDAGVPQGRPNAQVDRYSGSLFNADRPKQVPHKQGRTL